MRTVLLCDAAFSALPILFALRRRGFRVAVCGARATDPGHALADRSFVVDYSDPENVLRIVREAEISYIIPGCTDVSYVACANAAATLGLPGFDTPETTAIIHSKREFRAICTKKGFNAPKSVASFAQLHQLAFPVLLKPSRSYSGKGILRAEGWEDVKQILRLLGEDQAGDVIFEEFVPGDLYSHSALLRNRNVAWDVFVREYCTVYPYQVNSSYVPIRVDKAAVAGMRNWVEECALALGLADGLLHTQFIWDGTKFWLIEVTRRCPGDLYASLIERSTGAQYADGYASTFVESRTLPAPIHEPIRYVSRHTLSTVRAGTFLAARLDMPSARVAYVPLKRPGEHLGQAPGDRAGIYFVEHDSAQVMESITPRLREYASVEFA
jgi:biotin carboxylase